MSFPHLHVSSGFSAHYAVSPPEVLAQAAVERGLDTIALTDRDGISGAVKHLLACRDAKLRAVLGSELAVHDERGEPLGRVVVLAAGGDNGSGYAALCRAVSAAHETTASAPTGIHEPSIPLARLTQLATTDDGATRLTVLLGPTSDVGTAASAAQLGLARERLHTWLRGIPRSSLVVEVVCHLAEPGTPSSVTAATRMLGLATECGLRAVLTNAVRYASPEEAATVDIADAVRARRALDDIELAPTAQAWLKPASLMRQVARMVVDAGGHDASAADDLLAQTRALAEACIIDLERDAGIGTPRMPEVTRFGIDGDPFEVLRAKAEAAIPARYPDASGAHERELRDRLAHELKTVRKLGFAPYFLTVSHVVELIKDMGVRVQARGSGVGSLLNYLLYTSHVEPVSLGLIWERFLSDERRTLPDIDLDVESAERHRVYHRIFDEFGGERVTLMSMVNTYGSRGAVRDAGLALGLADGEVDRIAKELWRFSAKRFRQALAEKPELREFAEEVRRSRQLDVLVEATERLDSLPRHISVHPCGVILSDISLLDRTPVQMSGIGLPMSQFDKHDMDPMGLIKLDILGVRMQSAMAHAVKELKRTRGEDLDLDALPLDDEATYETIRSTKTLGIFQVESPGQMELVGKLQPEVFNDLIIDISLFRPGPMQNNMPLHFLRARHGEVMPDYIHPRLKPILLETKGVVVFHEQVMRIFDELTGCGLELADVYRRWLAKPDLVARIEDMVRGKTAERGFPPQVIDQAWRVLAGFGSFGFAKAHGAAFALPTFQSAWLKTHRASHFWAGLLTHDPGMWGKDLIVAEARHLGIPLLPIDVQRSGLEYTVEPLPDGRDGVRMSLADVRGMSSAERDRVAEHQPFDSLADFRARVRPRRSTLDSLARVGALDAFIDYESRRRHELLAFIRSLTSTPIRVPEHQQAFAFALPVPQLRGVTAMDLHGKTQTDLELQELGLGVSHHQMERFFPLFRQLGVVPASTLIDLPGGTEVLIAGVRRATNTPPMRGGRRTVFVSLDDSTGLSQIVFFHDAQQRAGNRVFRTHYMLVRGKTRRSGTRGISVTGDMAWDLLEVAQLMATSSAAIGTGAAAQRMRGAGAAQTSSSAVVLESSERETSANPRRLASA
ncbi:DNA polymerase III subunit alpha [Pseudoclavibacter helvolus]|uniref:DNA-directed DNA polymerase n=2 Tax=Pseudoclavibacter helvolus TaxID=255205 RepID=A0A7W4UM65_9MICO|nr:DNA polymerase III subunit alpha [Pseudoclavibacter helvolus]MBB2957040.1 error-prone DNA polymerase [Pseudoclavibacter helvolus]